MAPHPYPTYKPSGAPWLGDVPEHWDVRRFKVFYREVDERSSTGSEELMSVSHKTGVTPRKQNVTMFLAESNVGYKVCRPGDIVVNTMWAYMAALGVAWQKGLVSPSYGVYRPLPHSNLNPDYIDRLLRTEEYRTVYLSKSTGITDSRLRLYPEQFLGIPLLCPPLAEQQAIVRYLDHADRRIRRYVSAKRRLIALLEEEKQGIVNRAVTRGLDPDVRLRPSGVEWLGDVPEHWKVRRLGHLATKFGSGITPRGGATVYQEDGIPFLRSQNIYFDELRLQNVARIAPILHQQLSSSHVKPGDVLLNITGASIGRTCSVPDDFDEGNVNQHVCIIRLRRGYLLPKFLAAYLSIPAMQREIQFEQSGASREGLTLQSIRKFRVVVPTLSEQAAIVDWLGEATTRVSVAVARARRQIELLEEYRTRLVADVVMGKLDVREAAAQLPEESGEDGPIDYDGFIMDNLDDDCDASQPSEAVREAIA